MQDYLVKVENEHVANAVGLFIDNYKDPIAKFVNNVVKNEAGSADAFISKNKDGVWEVYQNAPDKGFVLGQTATGVQLVEYKSLSSDDKYAVLDGDKLALFIKTDEGTADIKVGHFLNINEVVTQIDSESVKLAIDTIKSGIRNAVQNAIVDKKKTAKAERRKAKSPAKG